MRNIVMIGLIVATGLASTTVAQAGKPGSGGGGTVTSYSGRSLGVLPGDGQSFAKDVNDHGVVVGRSFGGAGSRGFYWKDGAMNALATVDSGNDVYVNAISGGDVPTIVGWQSPSKPGVGGPMVALIWRGFFGAAEYLDPTRGCAAHGISDDGRIISGSCPVAGGGTIWSWNDTYSRFDRQDIAAWEGFGHGIAWDVNSSGVAVGSQEDATTYAQFAYLRKPGGTVIRLDYGTEPFSQASAVSEVKTNAGDSFVYVAGRTCSQNLGQNPDADFTSCRGIRWKVNLTTDVVTAEVTVDLGTAAGVNGSGDAGNTKFSVSKGGSVRQSARLWKAAGTFIALQPPKGGVDAVVVSLQDDVLQPKTYVVGGASQNNWPVAVLWTVNK